MVVEVKDIVSSLRLAPDLSYELEEGLNSLIRLLNERFNNYELYLFGSFVKRCVSDASDIDILMLVDSEDDNYTLRKLKISILCDIPDFYTLREIDLKLYNKSHFNHCKETKMPSFENEISKYMIRAV